MIKKYPTFFRAKGNLVKRLFKKEKPKVVQKEIGPKYFSKCDANWKSTYSTYVKIKVHAQEGEPIKFTFTPRSYSMFLSKDYVEILDTSQEIADSESAWWTYSKICSLIYNHEQAMGLFSEPWEQETDIYLWIKPYEEPVVERDMYGIPQRKIRRATIKPSRLRRRTLFVKWMMENSDWQEQLVLHYWNLPRKGSEGETLLPWFTLEVEYRKGARKKLCEDYHEYFCAVEAQGAYGCSMEVDGDVKESMGENPEIFPGNRLEIGLDLVVLETVTVPMASSTEGGSSTSMEDSLNTSHEPTTSGSEVSSTDEDRILPGDGLMIGSGKVSVNPVEVRPISCVSMIPHAGKIEDQQTVYVGDEEVSVFGDEGVSV